MNPTTKKAKTVSEVIKDLEEIKERLGGDPEVFMVNVEDGGFDGFGQVVGILGADTDEHHVAVLRSDVFIRPKD